MSSHGALMVLDRLGAVVEWSRAAEELLGRPAESALGSPAGPLLAGLADQVPHTPTGLRIGPLPQAGADPRWGVWTAGPRPNGERVKAARVRARLDLLHTARARVGQSLDLLRTAQELVDVIVPAFADSAVVALSDTVLRGEDPQTARIDGPPLLRCAATGRVDEEDPAPEVGAILLPGLFGDDLYGSASLRAHSHSTLVAPLTVRGTVLGAVAFHRSQRPEPFEDADLALAESLAGRTALSLDNALRYTREHTVTLALQGRRAVPSSLTQSAAEIAYRQQDADRGGAAWFDVISLSGARIALVAGRVRSPGIRALAAMSQLRTAVHTLADLDLDPHDLLARLHDTAERLAAEQQPRAGQPELEASCTYAVYDPVGGRCTVAQAGEQLLLAIRPDGTVDPAPVAAGPLLASGGPPFASAEFELTPGSTLCLASHRPADDGPGLGRLVVAVCRPDRPVQEVADGLSTALPQDAVVVVARTRTLTDSQVAEWPLPAELSAVSQARRLARDQLAHWEPDADPFALELVVSELVTNAIRYGAAPIALRLVRERTLTCEVADGALTAPHLRHAKAGDEGGRGLLITASLAENWGVRYTDSGKTVWASLPPAPEG